eukprot:g10210.t1
MDADLNFSGPAAGTLEGEVTAVIKNEKNELNRIRNAVEELATGAGEMCAEDGADLSAPHLPGVDAERIAAAERRAAQMYFGFIRIPGLEQGNDVIFYCSDVRSDFDLRLRKGDVVELRIAKRSEEVVEELKRGYARDTSGVAGQMSFRVGDGSSLALACVLRYCVVSDIDGAADTGDKSGGGATAAPDGHVALLVQEICRNFIFVHRGHAHEQNITEHSEAEESYGTGIRTRRERFRFPKAHRRGTGTATGSQKNEDSQERLRFFLTVLLAENKSTTSRGRSATVGSATSRTSAGAHQEKCDDILEAVFVPVLQLCLKNSDLMRNFVLPALRCVRGVLAELQFSSSPSRVDTIYDDLLLRQSEMLVASRSSRGGGREQSMLGGNTTTTPDHLSLLHSWREAALRKPSLRELRDATMMFRDLRDSRVLKALPYDDEQHYMSVYTQLYRTEAYVGLCRHVERVIDLVNRDAGAKKLNFFESKVYRADFLGYYPLQSGPHKGSIALAFAAVPDYALYADDRKKLLKDWPSRGLMTGTLLAVSIDGRFASQAGLLYLTVELRDETQLRDHGVFVAVPVPDPHTAFCGAGWDGASAGPDEHAESVFGRIRKIMNAFAGDLSLQKCIRIVENPGFYPAAAPVLRNLAAQRCVPFASSIVRCEPPTVRTAQVGVECAAECEGEEEMLVVETEPSSIYALTATFPKDLVMKVKPDPASVTRTSKLKLLRNPSEEDMYTVRQFLLDVAHPKSELHRDSELHQEQLEAIAHVLQHEVSVIQGAPGTGKTFIAVRICLILRAMHRERDRGAGRSVNEARSEPFRQLALSFKNHAVDEFSMDLLDSDMPVVRIGSRSAEPRLREHTLSALVQERARLRRDTTASVLADSDDENNSVHKKNELAALNEEEFAHRVKEIRRRFKMEESLEVTPVIAAEYIDLEQLVNLFGVWAKKNEKMFFERKRRSLPTPAAVAASFLLRQCLPILVYFLNTCRNQGWPLPSLMTIIRFGGAHPEEALVIDPVFEAKMSSKALLQMRSIAHRYFAGNLRSELANAFCEFVLPAWMPTPQQTHDLAARLRGPILFEDAAMADHHDPPSASTNAQRDQDAGTEKFVSCNFPAAGGQGGVDEADDFSNDDELRRDRALLLEEARAETEFDLVKKISKVERAIDLTGIARPATGRIGDPLVATKIHYLPEIANSGRLKQHPAVKDQLLAQRDLWELNADDRCRFLQVVLERVAESREAAVAQLEQELSQIAKRRRVAEEADKLAVLTSRTNPVLAMTIDGACIQGELLARCHVDVVIFEEAGELLEAKQLACLPRTARQVIMIGDPLQLPPNPDTFELQEHYDFGTSLMERLISNGYPYRTLMKQSRMHPEISRLSRHVYPRLENHDAVVEELEKCAGLPARVWFWDTGSGAHCTGEVKRVSVTNAGEASRALGLAQKLVYDGVKPSQIGILAMYKGQATLIRGMTRKSEKLGVEAFLAGGSGATSSNQPQAGAGSEARWSKGNPFVASATIGELANRGRNPLGLVGGAAAYAKLDFDKKKQVHKYGSIEDVTVDSVDNFQGDQRDYIIVSFCRSNENHDCGFLKKSDTGAQRLNVALTRARCGVFLIGDRDCLQTDYLTTGKDRVTRARLVDRTKKIANPVFKNVFADLEASNLVGRKLPLSCPRHPENENLFCETAADWERGTFKCRMVCGLERSDCDHTCSLQCHPGECAAYRCHEMVSFECENDESHPSWEAPCFEKKAGAKCRQIVEFECSRCKDDTVFSAAAEKLASQSRRTLLRRQCFESQAAAERKCPATYEYTCKAGDHTHMRNCCENEIGKCERPTERLRKCGHRYQLPCYEFDNIFKGKGRFAEAGTTNDSDTEVEDDAAEMLAKYDNEPCMEIVREACARCGEGSLRRICSSAASEDQCDRVFDHTCQSCGAVGQRACSLPAEQFRCVKLLDEVCKNCNAAPVQRICSEPEPIAPCSHNIRHVCETCRVAGEKVCSEAYVCKTTSTHHCATCGQDAEIPCGHSEADFVCPTPTPFYCPVCNAFVKYYPCGASPTPRQLEEEFVCVAEVAHVCRRCDAEGTRPCAQPVHEYFCPQPCRKALPFCGHPCHRACGLPCPRDESECRLCALEKTERWLAEGCLSEEKTQEFAENSRCLLPTWQIEFTQASISEDMRSGTSVAGEAQDVMSRSPQLLDPENFEKRYKQLNVYKWEECEWVVSDSEPRQVWRTRFMSLDNRRLALLKLCKPGGSVWVNISGDEKDFHFKYDPKNRKKLAHDEIRQVGAGGAVAGKAGAGGGAARTAHHDDEALSSNLKEQRLVEAVQKYRFADEAACAPTVDKRMLCVETWAGVSLMENEGDGREKRAVADPSSSALLTSTRNLKRAATGSLDVALRMMLSSASATEWMGVRSTSKGARRVGDRRPVVVMNQGLLHLLSVLHTDYMQERFPRFEFHAYFDATTGLLFLWNSLQEMFPDRVKQHGEGEAKEIARKAGVKSRIDNRFAEHLVKSVGIGGDIGESENSTTFSRSRMNFGNVTELPSYPCSLLRVETLDQFFPVFAPSVSRDPSFLLYGCSPMLYVNGNGDAGTTRTATASTALNRTNKNGTRSTGNKAQCFLQCRRANPKTRAAHDSGWTDKKAVAKMFYGGNAYRLYAKLACGGSGAVALGFHDDPGRVESLLRVDTLNEYRQTFSYSLNHDLAQGGEVLGGVFAWLLDHVSTEELANQCVTAVKEDLRDQLAPGVEERNVLKGQQSSKGKARKGDEAGKGAGKTFGGPGGGYASEVRLRLGKAQAGTDYREELLAKIADFCEKWKQAETHGN